MAGWIYVMSNPAMPGLLKIGRSSREPNSARVFELSAATGVPDNFVVEYQALVRDELEAEGRLHRKFQAFRYNKEFFIGISPPKVISEIQRELQILHEDIFLRTQQEIQQQAREDDRLRAERERSGQLELRKEMIESIRLEERKFNDFERSNVERAEKEEKRLRRMLELSKWHPDKFSYGFNFGFAARTYPNGEIYVGSLNWNLPNGHGTYFWPNGVKHVGQWEKGAVCGWGRRTGPGWIRAGYFSNENLNGFGIEINGSDVRAGLWRGGALIFKR